jgi:hypothetical protein
MDQREVGNRRPFPSLQSDVPDEKLFMISYRKILALTVLTITPALLPAQNRTSGKISSDMPLQVVGIPFLRGANLQPQNRPEKREPPSMHGQF